MPVDDKHPLYKEYESIWAENRDATAGGRQVKAKETDYLPKLAEQNTDEYANYLLRAYWYGATGRTVEGYVGALMRKPPKVEGLDALADVLANVTQTGISFRDLMRATIRESVEVNRYGVLVEPGDGTTPRPRAAGYMAESIINWRTSVVDGEEALSLVVLLEKDTEQGKDLYSEEEKEKYRVLYLNEDGKYAQKVFRKIKDKDGKEILREDPDEERDPVIVRGAALDYIPFELFCDAPGEYDPRRPLLDDLVAVNFAHYRNTADHEHGLHYVGLPTPVVSDDTAPPDLRIGSMVAWGLSTGGSAEMLEFKGEGLGAYEKAQAAKEKQMAILGARLLEGQSADAEAAETVRLRQAGETSVLSALSVRLSEGLTQVAQWLSDFGAVGGGDVLVELNRDFFDAIMTAQDLTARVQAWQAGAYSWKTPFYQMERGEMTRPDVDADEEAEEIEKEQEGALRERDAAEGAAGPLSEKEVEAVETQLAALEAAV